MNKIDCSFIKASNNKHAFTDTWTETQIHNFIYTVAPDVLYNHAK